jgi:hypothetical protein
MGQSLLKFRDGTYRAPQGFAGYEQSSPRKECVGTLWPHGEWSTGMRTVPGYEERFGNRASRGDTLPNDGGAMGLSKASNLHTPPHPRRHGLHGISRYGKKMVKAAATLLQEKYGRGRLSFLTATLPHISESELETIVESWGALVNRLIQWIARRLERAGLPSVVISVTEFQSKRISRGDPAGHHIHLVFCGKKTYGTWVIDKTDVRNFWQAEIARRLGRGFETGASTRIERIRKSAAGYLGKYMSKGDAAVGEMVKRGWEWAIPRQWWNRTKACLALVRSHVAKGKAVGEYLHCLMQAKDNGLEGMEALEYVPIVRETDIGLLVCGYAGTISGKLRWQVRAMLGVA